MAKRKRATEATPSDLILETPTETTLLDVLDKLLNKGVVLSGDIVLGVAGVDLVYLRLSSLLCAIDRVFPDEGRRKRRHNRGPRRLKAPVK
jgi:Gas vesicle protein